ncbi:hypothetical protein SCLCIDRAFT_131839, partial [Scleroderma citrinum Foug A]
ILATCPTYENQCQVLKSASEDLVTSDTLGTKLGRCRRSAPLRHLRIQKQRFLTLPEVPLCNIGIILTSPLF